jgi:two-component system, LytTR family, response regulator
MIRALIIDDEERGRETLLNLLKTYCPEVKVLKLCDSVESGIKAIEEYAPELLFLDIEMNKATGFDLLEQLPGIDFDVIFTTAHENYALRAIKFCAIDYILKPIDVEELKVAVEKVITKKAKESFQAKFDLLLHNQHQSNPKNHRIAVSTNDGLVFLNVSDIIRCEADGSYTLFCLKNNEKIFVSKNLKEYEDLLSDHNFFRVHNSSLINLKEIVKYVRGDGGYVIMTDNAKVDVSKRKKDAFLTLISKI